MPAFGIDLGTTFSAISWVDDTTGKAQIITNFEGENTTPSVIFFDYDNKPSVGKIAQNQAHTDPNSFLYLIKRSMGMDYPLFIRNGKEFRAEFLSALILAKLKKDAEMQLGHAIQDVVISVPAYFGDAQRKATRNAARIAGLNAIHIINEPTAAALAYGLNKRHEDQTVLIYDLGGGTFDVSIIRIEQQQIRELATDGDAFLGGTDFDDAVKQWLGTEFLFEYQDNERILGWLKRNSSLSDLEGIFQQAMQAWEPFAGAGLKNRIQAGEANLAATVRQYFERDDIQEMLGVLFSDPLTSLLMSQVVEQNKRILSAKDAIPVTLQMPEQILYRVELSLGVFNLLTKHLIDETVQKVESVLRQAGLQREQLDKILLVGGSTRMRAVPEAVTNFLGKAPNRDIEPNQCVAQGAAYAAQMLSRKKDAKETPGFSSVIPHGLGVAVVQSADIDKPLKERRLVNSLVIKPGTALPAQSFRRYRVASDKSTGVKICVLQGNQDMPADECQTIGNLSISIPPRATDEPSIRVEFSYDLDGIVHVNVVDEKSGNSISDKLQDQVGLSETDIDDEISQFADFLPDL